VLAQPCDGAIPWRVDFVIWRRDTTDKIGRDPNNFGCNLLTPGVGEPMSAQDPGSLFEGYLPSPSALGATMAHPQFLEASRMVAGGLVALYQGERVINRVMPDRIRYIISVFALHLHFASLPNDPNSGLTVSRLRKLCVERQICSAGRAEAMLAIMRGYGHLVPASGEADRRLRRLVPAEPLYDWHRKRCIHFFAAAAKVMPEHAQALAALDAPGFMPHFVRHLARQHAGGFHYVVQVPDVRPFYERNAGGAILMSIMLSGASDDTFPPSRPVSISLSAIARDFGVSRVHVGRLVQEGVNAGLLERTGSRRDEVVITPRLSEAVRRVIAHYIVHYTHCARLAHADIGASSAVA
jgi:hypothetical protein